MLYLVSMRVELPSTMPEEQANLIKAKEKAYAQELLRAGLWRHLWRVVGQYANYSVFDVQSNDHLHQILSGLPLFPYMRIEITPLAAHPSAL
jgi:muconolactone D-isomerase